MTTYTQQEILCSLLSSLLKLLNTRDRGQPWLVQLTLNIQKLSAL